MFDLSDEAMVNSDAVLTERECHIKRPQWTPCSFASTLELDDDDDDEAPKAMKNMGLSARTSESLANCVIP